VHGHLKVRAHGTIFVDGASGSVDVSTQHETSGVRVHFDKLTNSTTSSLQAYVRI
jgi:hypothetical protein